MHWIHNVLKQTLELHLCGLIGTASHPDIQTIPMIGVSFENRQLWQFEVGKKNYANGYL
jgi:hypothetical protein